ncbi:MAG: S41 family peptidase [Anaerolineae bacterium]|nr:S41 family peptidase [Anaerolineae bacterium]
MTSLNDQFTTFSPPEIAEVRRQELSGHFGGIGVTIDLNENNEIVVVMVIPGNPADQAGIEVGDVFREVDGTSVIGWTTDMLGAQVRGELGTLVRLTMYRPSEGSTYEVNVRRAIIEIPTVFTEQRGDIGYMRLSTFSGVASEQMEQQIAALLEDGIEALVLDLRGNGGGLLEQAVEVADLFLPEGVVLTQRNADGSERVYRSDDGDVAEEIPLVVLIDGGSASASEVVAGALQDRDRAELIGQQTFGKGVVQRVYNLTDGSQLRVVSSAWYTPEDRAIQDTGLVPDVLVAERFAPAAPGEDPLDLFVETAVSYFERTLGIEGDSAD